MGKILTKIFSAIKMAYVESLRNQKSFIGIYLVARKLSSEMHQATDAVCF